MKRVSESVHSSQPKSMKRIKLENEIFDKSIRDIERIFSFTQPRLGREHRKHHHSDAKILAIVDRYCDQKKVLKNDDDDKYLLMDRTASESSLTSHSIHEHHFEGFKHTVLESKQLDTFDAQQYIPMTTNWNGKRLDKVIRVDYDFVNVEFLNMDDYKLMQKDDGFNYIDDDDFAHKDDDFMNGFTALNLDTELCQLEELLFQ